LLHCFRSSQSAPQSVPDLPILDFPSRPHFPGHGNRLTYLKQLLNDASYPKSD